MSTWYNAAWGHRHRITLNPNAVQQSLYNYILYLDETEFTALTGQPTLFDSSRADGKDIIVTAADGYTPLLYELVSYNSSAKKMELYIRVPFVSSVVNTTIFVYYGNPSHVEVASQSIWNNYQYVSHNGGITDIRNGDNASPYGAPVLYGATSQTSGFTGVAASLPGAGDIIDTELFNISLPMTFQVNVKPLSDTEGNVLGTYKNGLNDLYLYRYSNQWVMNVDKAGGSLSFGTVNVGQWNQLAVTVDGTMFNSFQNGQLANYQPGSASGTITSGNSLKINDKGDFLNSATGGYLVDEIRIFNGVLPAEYLNAEYINYNNPVFLYTVSPQEEVSGIYLDLDEGQISLDGTLLPTIAIGINIIEDSLASFALSYFIGAVGTGANLLLDNSSSSIRLVPYVASIIANNQVIGLNISLSPGPNYTGGMKFKPTRRLELYSERNHFDNKDTTFISGIVRENINIGGVVCYIWLIEGTIDQTDATGAPGTQIDESMGTATNGILDLFGTQDVILGENRDRAYAQDAVRLKGTYSVSANELDFARFGIMLNNDILQVEFHKGEMEKMCGRRLIPGDVVEMPHLREVGLGNSVTNKFYQVESIVKAPNGYDFTYNYHILAVTMRPISDAQEFLDLLNREDEYGNTIASQMSNRDVMEEVTEKIQQAATEQAYQTGWDITPLYVSDEGSVFSHRWAGDGLPPNGKPVQMLTYFPSNPNDGDYVCRVDNFPNRLYRFQANRWLLKEVDRKRDWQPYNWTKRLREFSTDRSLSDDMRPWEYKSVHDVLTPRQGRSNPSPKGHDITAVELFDWERQIKVTVPNDNATADPVIRMADLTPRNSPAIVADFLNATAGQYNFFLVYYVMKQGPNQITGELLISDDGAQPAFEHEWNDIGSIDVTFSVMIEDGLRKLKYTLAGTDTVHMTYFVQAKWSIPA